MPATFDDEAHVLPRRNSIVFNLVHMGVSDHRMTAAFPIDGFESLSRNPALAGLGLVNRFQCAIAESEYGSPDGVSGLGSNRRKRTFPLSVGERKDQLRFGEMSDELELGVRGDGPQALRGYERRIRKVQGAQGSTSSSDSLRTEHCSDSDQVLVHREHTIVRTVLIVCMRLNIRHIASFAALGLMLAACGSGGEPGAGPSSTSNQTGGADTETSVTSAVSETSSIPSSSNPTADGPSALDAAPGGLSGDGFPEPLIDTKRLLQGQVPDGIPSIDVPRFVEVETADAWLTDEEALVVLEINGEVRAYPVQVLIWHEIVNDVVGGLPVAITYCPLCNSAVTYERRVDGQLTTFGTSGFLFNSALVMYDRATESLWTHFDGRAIAGVRTGSRLEPISSPLLAWADFKAAYPDGMVLDAERTGYSRPYGSNPYVGYDDAGSFPFLFDGEVDDRAPAKQRVVGVNLDGVSMAWALEVISGDGPVATDASVGVAPLVIFWKPGQSSALDASGIDAGRDVGSVGVFRPEVDGRRLTFEATLEGFEDVETRSTWNILGEAIFGPMVGERLTPVAHLDTFWFAWLAYNPATGFSGT